MEKINATTVLALFRKIARPLPWRDLQREFTVTGAREKRILRDVLRGLQRSGELLRDHRGAYQLPGEGEVQVGVIERRGRTLMFAGLPLAPTRQSWLRATGRTRGARGASNWS